MSVAFLPLVNIYHSKAQLFLKAATQTLALTDAPEEDENPDVRAAPFSGRA